MARRRTSRQKSPHTLPIIASLVVFFGIFLTVYLLMKTNTDIRGLASGEDHGIGQAVREEMSPSVRISTPKANSVATNPVIITADVPAGSDVERVQFWVDSDKESANEVFAAPFEASVTLSPGRHRVSVLVVDHEGNIKRSQEVPFLVQ